MPLLSVLGTFPYRLNRPDGRRIFQSAVASVKTVLEATRGLENLPPMCCTHSVSFPVAHGPSPGDCCPCTCGQFVESVDELLQSCGRAGDGYDCQDPDVPADCGATPSPAASFGYPDCDGYLYNFQNSYCNDDLNNAECGWDGGTERCEGKDI